MISFRFHVVSLTAVFLAIAIGVLVGTTYVEGAVVDGLENRIDTVEENLDSRRAENDRLDDDLQDARAYIDASQDYVVTDRLTDEPTLLLAVRGVDEDAVQQVALLTGRAGAVLPGVVWLEDRWTLENDEDEAALEAVLGDSAPEGGSREELQRSAWEAVMAEVSAPEPGPGAGAPPSTIEPLIAEGFLSVDALEDVETSIDDLRRADPGVAIVRGGGAPDELEALVPVVVEAAVAAGRPTVAADVFEEVPEGAGRGEELVDSLSEDLREQIALVDGAERTEGQVAVVLALDAVAAGVTGHFGTGDGASGILPEWTPP